MKKDIEIVMVKFPYVEVIDSLRYKQLYPA